VCVVISNYSRLQNIENTSQDLIHCKMQGALNGKTMRVVYVRHLSFFHSNRLHSCTTTVELLWKKIQ